MSYKRNIPKNSILEGKLRQNNLHKVEDYLRLKFIKNYITSNDNIIIARILHGRILNSLYSTIDSRHSKSQLITLLCISFCLSKRKNSMNLKINRDLFDLLQYHKRIIYNFIMYQNIEKFNENDKKYYHYCKEWYSCIDLLLSTEKINDEDEVKIMNLRIYLATWLPSVDNKYYDSIIEDKYFINYLKKLNVKDFIS
jgi:hypothetical protein